MSEAVDTKREQTETLLADVFKLMEYPAKLEFKDMTDGSLGVAVHFDGELPGITAGKRSHLVDSVQFWLNKVVNRPNTTRRWVNLGVNSFPEPRAQQAEKPEKPAKVEAAAPVAKKEAPKKEAAPVKEKPAPVSKKVDERTLKPAADPLFTAAGKLLAEKSAKLGRVYAVMGLSNDQRALMLQAADAVKGQTAKAEGEGHWRRFTVTPEKLTVIPRKQVMPDYDDEDEDE
ncbi:MAG: hypothetical protein DI536_18370 [Archangium gephyra]|uniref:Uncharacterized protein n=1 Tax=Archangium gephyra TaxID=48 RepID=A0A2W5TD41_9BACT|nr:MAG: hypothetical protein DI536_18370 [Archangium gephyra]